MTEDRHDEGGSEEQAAFEDELERTRKLILERRNRFMAAALAGLGMTGGNACTRASVCLDLPAEQAGRGGGGGGGNNSTAVAGRGGTGGTGGRVAVPPSVCLGALPTCPEGQLPPCVCLDAPISDAGPADGGEDDGGEGEASDGG